MRLDVGELTAGQPFCAGLVLVRDGELVLAIHHDGRVSLVGGGQEPRETPWECALREAHEEVGASVDLVPAPATWFYDWESQELERVESVDADPPLLVERFPRDTPDVAYREGLPTGPYVYFVTFLATVGRGAELHPGHDQTGLLLLPLDRLDALEGEVVGTRPAADLWLHAVESFRLVRPLLDEPAVRAALGI